MIFELQGIAGKSVLRGGSYEQRAAARFPPVKRNTARAYKKREAPMETKPKPGPCEFGMPTLLETGTVEACAALCRELGLRFVELNMNLPQYQPERIDAARLGRIAAEYGVYYTIHLDENLNVCDFNRRVAAAWRETVYETIGLAKALGCPILNMHLARGVYFTLPERRVYLFEEYRETYLGDLRAFRDACGEKIGPAALKICVENGGGYTAFEIEALEVLLESEAFGLTFDIGHDKSGDGSAGAYILGRVDRLAHMHAHDAARAHDASAHPACRDHLALGTGEVDAARYLALAAARGCRVVLETKTVAGLRQSAAWVRAHAPS